LLIEPKITFEQYQATLKAMREPNKAGFGTRHWLRVGLIVIFFFATLILAETSADPQGAALAFVMVSASLVALWTFGTYYTRYCLKKLYRAQEQQLNQQQMAITESGISGNAVDGTVTYSYKWSAFERFIEMPDAFLLLPNLATFLRIPKEHLSAEDQENIRQWRSRQ